jgi:hypothetical protein
MTLGTHTRNESGRIRKERNDTLLGTLAREYSPLRQFNPRMKLGTLEKQLNVDSLDQVLKKIK